MKNGGKFMSIESAKSFIERMKTDEAFAKKVTACKDAEERSAFVQEEGFDFTASELREAGTVLSDDDLEGVAGGRTCTLNFTIN
jgi:predicted ribosomally synthesized peptide with nif11-like leader